MGIRQNAPPGAPSGGWEAGLDNRRSVPDLESFFALPLSFP